MSIQTISEVKHGPSAHILKEVCGFLCIRMNQAWDLTVDALTDTVRRSRIRHSSQASDSYDWVSWRDPVGERHKRRVFMLTKGAVLTAFARCGDKPHRHHYNGFGPPSQYLEASHL